jgi:hypothetical protein
MSIEGECGYRELARDVRDRSELFKEDHCYRYDDSSSHASPHQGFHGNSMIEMWAFYPSALEHAKPFPTDSRSPV